jgi:hypothetical protein
MKKTLRLTLLAAAAALVLTSCDAMLESLFPKDTIGDTSGAAGQNSITVDVSGWDYYSSYTYSYLGFWAGYYVDYLGGPYGTIHVQLYDQQGNQVDGNGDVVTSTTYTGLTTGFSSGGYGYARTASSVTFYNLKDGSYNAKVWYDFDNDGTPSTEMSGYYSWYYTDYGTIDGNNQSNVYLPVNGSTRDVSWEFDLYEYPYYGY